MLVVGCDPKKPPLPETPQVPVETLSGFPDNADFNDGPFALKTREPEDRSTGREMHMLYRGAPIAHPPPAAQGEHSQPPPQPPQFPLTFARRVHNGPAAYVLSYDCRAVDLVMENGERPTVTVLQETYDPPLDADVGGQNACAGLRMSANELIFPGTRIIEEKRDGTMYRSTVEDVKVLNTDTLDIQTYRRPEHDVVACMAGSAEACDAGKTKSAKTKSAKATAEGADVSVTVEITTRAVDDWDRLLLIAHSPDAQAAAWITPSPRFTTDDSAPRTVIVTDAAGEHPRKVGIPGSLQTRLTTATERTQAQYPMTPAWLATAFDWQKDSHGEWTLVPRKVVQAAAAQGLQTVAAQVEAVLVDPASIDSLTLAGQLQDSMGGKDAARGADGLMIPLRPWPPQVFAVTGPHLTPFSVADGKTAARNDANHPAAQFLLGISTRENGGEPGGTLVLTFTGDTPSLEDESGMAALHDRLEAWLNARHAPHFWAKPAELRKSAALAQRLRDQLGWPEPQIAGALAMLGSEQVNRALEDKASFLFTKAGAFMLDTTSVGIPNPGLAWDLWAIYRLPSSAHTALSEQVRNAVLFPAYGEYLTASLPTWLQAGQLLDDSADKEHQPDAYLLRRPLDLFGLSVLSIRPEGEGYSMRIDGRAPTTLAALETALQGMKVPYVVLPPTERQLKEATKTRLHEQLGWSPRRIEDWANSREAGTEHGDGTQLITNRGVIGVSQAAPTADFQVPASILTMSRGAYPGHPDAAATSQ
ncbi:hypothetical protein [Paraburkholderia antibiotica]|uniref:Uncharacterized protein n=1 Tax=Paraburkholderia antibiotica TaxID=2728839 RepID=A0A7X9X6H6_9BURK|nr:hypothetical protein [Paraburkholderia antibiotica]NML32336.1 hypothetical protein [Paraburkholderia antibiotica]